ncbi:MAG TPA: UDP-3-O-(3-hydroxymyristoyl)glucosamine N-acyltransferase [Planctomycetota bacterium]|nr:UDP-3-O-(3-hydroxymyristoyl)glucosamine N-acyltransferase [Planctomycetota bacterium]
MRVDELVKTLKATLVLGDPAVEVTGAANLREAGPSDISHFSDARYAPDLQVTKAAAVLLKSVEGVDAPQSTALLQVPDPEVAFIQVLTLLYPAEPEKPGVDPRAVVEPGVDLGEGVYVGPFAVIRKGARVGARAVIHAHAVVGRNCSIGEGTIIHSHAVLYDNAKVGKNVVVHAGTILGADGFGYKFRGGRHVKVPQVGVVDIGDDVEIGANACIDRAALGATRVGSGTKIDNLVQVGHNVSIGKHCILCGQAAIAGSSGMDDYAVLGGNAGIADHVFMGKGSKAGAKSGVGKDVPPGAEVWGMFAEERKIAFRQLASIRRLPELIERVRELEKRLAELEPKK